MPRHLKWMVLLVLLVSLSMALAAPALSATETRFAGRFSGAEPRAPIAESFGSPCGAIDSYLYSFQTFQVSVTVAGQYDYFDVSYSRLQGDDIDTYLSIYTPDFIPSSVLANCVINLDDGDNTPATDNGLVTLTAGVTYVFVVYDYGDSTGRYEFTLTGPGPVNVIGGSPLADGRINLRDAGAPYVIYPHRFSGGMGFQVYSVQGQQIWEITPEQIAAVADCPTAMTEIASLPERDLYFLRLPSCEFQFQSPSFSGAKTYIVVWSGYQAGGSYRSSES